MTSTKSWIYAERYGSEFEQQQELPYLEIAMDICGVFITDLNLIFFIVRARVIM